MKSKHTMATLLLAGSSLGSGGIAIHQQRELDAYILDQINQSLADPSWMLNAQYGEKTFSSTPSPFAGLVPQLQAEKHITQNDFMFSRGTSPSKAMDSHYGPIARNTEHMARMTGLKHGIRTPFHFEYFPNNRIDIVIGTGNKKVNFYITTGALDTLTAPEMRFAIAHEIAGHLKTYTDENGHIHPWRSRYPDDNFSWKKLVSRLPSEQYDQHQREEQADRAALRETCDTAAATRLFAKSAAQEQKIPLTVLQHNIAKGLEFSPLPMLHALKENMVAPSYGQHDTHPHWKERVRAVVDEAKVFCKR